MLENHLTNLQEGGGIIIMCIRIIGGRAGKKSSKIIEIKEKKGEFWGFLP